MGTRFNSTSLAAVTGGGPLNTIDFYYIWPIKQQKLAQNQLER